MKIAKIVDLNILVVIKPSSSQGRFQLSSLEFRFCLSSLAVRIMCHVIVGYYILVGQNADLYMLLTHTRIKGKTESGPCEAG